MNPRRLWAMMQKEFVHIRRDPRSLILALGIPVFMMLLYCYALSLDIDHLPMAVLDRDHSAQSRSLIKRFTASGYFDVARQVDSYREVARALDRGEAVMGLVIPRRFAGMMQEDTVPVPLQVFLDGSDPNRASIALGYARAIAQIISDQKLASALDRVGVPPQYTPLDVRLRVWFNPEMKSKNFIIPGLIAVIMAILASLLISLTVAREWEQNTMEMLISSPVTGAEIILGKLIPYLAIGLVDTSTIILTGRYVFNVPLRGNPLLLMGVVTLFLVGAFSFGITVSVITRSQYISSLATMVATYVPTVLLSGFVFSISSMPRFLQIVSYLVPSRYLITSLKGIYLKGVGFSVIQLQVLYMCAFAAIFLALAIGRFRKRLD